MGRATGGRSSVMQKEQSEATFFKPHPFTEAKFHNFQRLTCSLAQWNNQQRLTDLADRSSGGLLAKQQPPGEMFPKMGHQIGIEIDELEGGISPTRGYSNARKRNCSKDLDCCS